jgi:hypothetical protein
MRPEAVRYRNGHTLPANCAEVGVGMPDGGVDGRGVLCRSPRIPAREVQPV